MANPMIVRPIESWAIDYMPERPVPEAEPKRAKGKGKRKAKKGPLGLMAMAALEWDRRYLPMKPKAARMRVARFAKLMDIEARYAVYEGDEDVDAWIERELGEKDVCLTDDDFHDLVRPWPRKGWSGDEVASLKFEDTPRSLYLLLYVTRPRALDMSDMYKTGAGFVAFTSACGRFGVRMELWKYELAARFYVLPSLSQRTLENGAIQYNGPAVKAGAITAADLYTTKDDDALAFFDMIRVALTRKWRVYPGNDFEV